jgi:hypothetical protein
MKFVVMVDGKAIGSFETNELVQAVQEGRIPLSAKAWRVGQDDWRELKDIPELKALGFGSQTSHWYYVDGDKTFGPKTAEEMKMLLLHGSILTSTYVFREGLENWTKIESLSEFETDVPPARRSPASEASNRAEITSGTPDPTIPGSTPRTTTAALIPPQTQAKNLFVWWPSSIWGSSILAAILAYSLALLVGEVLALIVIVPGLGRTLSSSDILASLFVFIIPPGIYLLSLGLRYFSMVAPYKRVLRRSGINQNSQKVYFYDLLMENPKAFFAATVAILIVMALEIGETNRTIGANQDQIGSDYRYAQNVQHNAEEDAKDPITRMTLQITDEQLQADYDRALRNGVPSDLAWQDYQNAKRSVDETKATVALKASTALSNGVGALKSATASALKIKASKIARVWAWAVALLACAFSFWLWVQTRKERSVPSLLVGNIRCQ